MKKHKPKPEDAVKDEHQIENIPVAGAELFQFLLDGPELRIKQSPSKENKEKEFERLAILGASQISLDAIKNFVLHTAKAHQVTFPQVYYKEMFRLKGWKVQGANVYRKPWLVAKYTVEVIYGRFTKDILMAIKLQNPYIVAGVRRFKHFQYLNEAGQSKLEQFIDEAVEVMKNSTTWYEFRVKMFEQHGVPYQMDLFN
ncbi:P63C domain-containing protein [Pedobacter lithocola]|uniref:P63C domain-containing protein n=1 Tax=Pedobacter lithocola TaxID=1908239 RepID=A0ABV8P9R0_9SPHI